MDLINDEPSMSVEGEDRISNLPDDIIHRFLSFLDMKYAIQTCTLSHRWKRIWTSIPNLNFDSRMFHDLPQFTYFVKHALARRNSLTEVFVVDLTFTGLTTESVVENIVDYAYSHNARQLTMTWNRFPQYLFSSHTLKYLTIINQGFDCKKTRIPYSWNFPALETLNLENIRIGGGKEKSLDLFSKSVYLKDITFHNCYMHGLDVINLCAPQLLNLTITGSDNFPKVFNVVAPLLKNLTASVVSKNGGLPSNVNFLRLSTKGFSSLEKVNLFTSNGDYNKQKVASIILNLFHVVRNAKLLILDVAVIECLSSRLDQLMHEPCPFDNLKCLKINICLKRKKQNDPIPRKLTQVKYYLLENSPNATFIMELPQVSHKRSREHAPDDTMPLKVAKLDAKTKQPETMPDESRMLEATLQIRDQLIANLKIELQKKDQVIANLNANIQMKDQVIADQNANMQMNDQVTANQNVNIQMKDQVIANQKENIQMKDQVIENQNENIQLKDQIIEKQKAMMHMLKSKNIHMQPDVPAPSVVP